MTSDYPAAMSVSTPLRVGVAAASPVVRAGLGAMLEEAGCGRATVVATWPEIPDSLPPDIDLLIAALTPGSMAGEETFAFPEVPLVLLIAEGENPPPGPRGPHALLPAETPADDLLAAVEAVARGLIVVHPALLARTQALPRAAEGPLTAREVDVLRLMADGLANKTIAGRLGISEHTAKFHVASILGKLAAESRTEAVSIALRRGLLPL